MSEIDRRFSLIELLVVVAIIGILTSLLMPSLSSARESARTAQCINNMKQNMTATMLYLDDNNFTFWPSRPYNPNTKVAPNTFHTRYRSGKFYDTRDKAASAANGNQWGSYKVRIWDYLPSIDVQICPSHDDGDEKHRYQFSYGFSIAYDSPIDAIDEENRRKITLSSFSTSANKLGTIADIDETTHTEVIQRAYQIYARHNGKVPLAYLDGHVEATNVTLFFNKDVQWNYLGMDENGNGLKNGGNKGTSAWMDKGDPVVSR